jgi:hypothetical protein
MPTFYRAIMGQNEHTIAVPTEYWAYAAPYLRDKHAGAMEKSTVTLAQKNCRDLSINE